MCGIIGEYSLRSSDDEFLKQRDLLSHRGPDSSGFIKLYDNNLRLGHRRLSILDLSEKANQPLNVDGYIIIYNGEVYNFKELKSKFNLSTVSNSDTEIILRGYIAYGSRIFSLLDGMFALAIYDPKKEELVLARDRFGVKPFYYYQSSEQFIFASEIAALKVPFCLSQEAVKSFLQQNYIYSQEEIIKGVYSLPVGSYSIFDLKSKKLEHYQYDKKNNYKKISNLTKAKKDFITIMEGSVKASLISDVPVGVFLSAGNDSSLLAAIAQNITGGVKTFTIGFDTKSFDESARAEKIAKIIGSEHYTFKLNKEEIIETIPVILDSFHMPFGDSSALPFYFLSKYTREHVKVCLSGDGADELFGGYPLYYLPFISNLYKALPFKRLMAEFFSQSKTSFNKMSFDYKIKRFLRGAGLDYRQAHFAYRSMDNQGVLKKQYQKVGDFDQFFNKVKDEDIENQLMSVDQKTILERDYLIKVDRMSMAHSLEVRVPYLNNSVSNFSRQLDSRLKVRNFTTKYLLKKTLEDYLPKNLIYTKKEGFSFPIADWLCDELKDFMLETLSYDRVVKTGFLEYSGICRLIDDHLSHRQDYNRELWGLISLVRYLDKHNS